MSRYFDRTHSLRIILIRKCLCKAIRSLLSGAGEEGRGKCLLGLDGLRGGKCVSDHVMSVMSVLALQPSTFHITGGCAEGGGVVGCGVWRWGGGGCVQRDLLHLHQRFLFLFVGVGESDTRGGIFSFATQKKTCMFVCICQVGLMLAEQCHHGIFVSNAIEWHGKGF